MLEHRQVDEGRPILARLAPEYEYDLDADGHKQTVASVPRQRAR